MRRFFAITLILMTVGCVAPVPVPSYPIFFSEWSAQLDEAGTAAIARAADSAKSNPFGTVNVAGYAAPVGSAQANADMSQVRAQVVADQLVADGVDVARIKRVAHGATDFALTSQESRRVDIILANP
jgi:outer membrane protein OmpA-like peptidoglycan-associated protein